jgi:hypothetical protein
MMFYSVLMFRLVMLSRQFDDNHSCRLIPVGLLGAMRNFLGGVSNILVTSSCDHTIRLWGKVILMLHILLSPHVCHVVGCIVICDHPSVTIFK